MSETIATAKQLAREYMQRDIPCFITGDPGVGKSDLWKQLAQEGKMGFIDQRMGAKELVDLQGLPALQEKNGVIYTTWARPDFLPVPSRDGERGIFLIDELSDCSKPMQSVLYQLFLNRCINDHKIPDGWYLCAAGNTRSSKAAAQTLSSALMNRFAHIHVQPCQKAFDKWAVLNGIHELIVGYLRFKPTSIHNMDGTDLKAFPSPRSWAMASKLCNITDEDLLFRAMRGVIGEGEAGEFIAKFFRTLNIPTFDEVIAAPKKCFIPSEPSSKYVLSATLAYNSNAKNIDKVMEYCKRPQFGVELEVCVMLDAIERDANILDTKTYSEFGVRNQHIHF